MLQQILIACLVLFKSTLFTTYKTIGFIVVPSFEDIPKVDLSCMKERSFEGLCKFVWGEKREIKDKESGGGIFFFSNFNIMSSLCMNWKIYF